MTLYAIDPGTEQSAIISYLDDGKLIAGKIIPNAELLSVITGSKAGEHLVIEQIESYGMAVGREVFETVFWSGRFAQRWEQCEGSWSRIGRKAVKLALCGSPRAKDANIRQALIDRYGGSQCIKKGGALYGIKSHLWAALALAETYRMQSSLALAKEAK